MTAIALLGSGEFEPWARPVDKWCADHVKASSNRALVVPTASAPEGDNVFRRWGEMGVKHYEAIGFTPQVLELCVRADASPERSSRSSQPTLSVVPCVIQK